MTELEPSVGTVCDEKGAPKVGDAVLYWPGLIGHGVSGVSIIERGPYEMGGTQVVYLTRHDEHRDGSHDHISLSHVQVVEQEPLDRECWCPDASLQAACYLMACPRHGLGGLRWCDIPVTPPDIEHLLIRDLRAALPNLTDEQVQTLVDLARDYGRRLREASR